MNSILSDFTLFAVRDNASILLTFVMPALLLYLVIPSLMYSRISLFFSLF